MSHYSDLYYGDDPKSPGSVVGLDIVEDQVGGNRHKDEVTVDLFDGWMLGEEWVFLRPSGVLGSVSGLSPIDGSGRQGDTR